MKHTYKVEMRGDVRELYSIEADSADEAREKWHEGDLFLSEASGMEIYSVEEDE